MGRLVGSVLGKRSCRSMRCVSAGAAHLRQLSKLREAMEVATVTPQSAVVAKTLQTLQQKWRAADEVSRAPSADDQAEQALPKGVRRLPGALEYDLTMMDDSDDEGDDDGAALSGERRLPREMKYFDTASINIRAGDGGTGCCAFRREKFVAHGGPNGGNGGDGGSIWAVAEEGVTSLAAFRNAVHWKAADGENGQGKDMHGRNAEDLFIKVPVGTIVRRKGCAFDEPPLAELIAHGQKALLMQGGRGGRGNAAFKSGKNKAPIIAEDGEAGADMWLDLELKLVADVGIIGVPNAGKSTLLSVLSSARPKIANYPFTTLVPNLGVCEMDYETTVFADVPGILEGAHTGHGLGHAFLRHVSRSRALVHVIDGTSPDPLYDYRAIRMELRMFSPELARKPQIVAYNKIDVPDSGDYVDEMVEALSGQLGVQREHIVPISAVAGDGILDLIRAVRGMLKAMPAYEPTLETNALNLQEKVRSPTDAARVDDFTIEADLGDGRTWFVYSDALERFAQMTNWDYFEATLRFQRVLQACGLSESLRKRGVQEGDAVVIGGREFAWSDDQSDGALYEAWLNDVNSRGRVRKGSQRWPHASG